MSLEEYKGVFIFAQQVDNELSSIALELLGKAKNLAEDLDEKKVTAVLLGSDVKGLVDKLAVTEPKVRFLQLEIAATIFFCEVHKILYRSFHKHCFLWRIVRIFLKLVNLESEELRFLKEHLGHKDPEHVAGSLFYEPKVEGGLLLLVSQPLGDAALAGVVAGGHGHPIAVFGIGLLEELACSDCLFLNVIALVHLVVYHQAIFPSSHLCELPESSRTGR